MTNISFALRTDANCVIYDGAMRANVLSILHMLVLTTELLGCMHSMATVSGKALREPVVQNQLHKLFQEVSEAFENSGGQGKDTCIFCCIKDAKQSSQPNLVLICI